MSVGKNIAKGALQTVTGNIETAQIIIHDYRQAAQTLGVGKKNSALAQEDALAAFSGWRVDATKEALTTGTAPSYSGSQDKVFKVQFNPSQLTLNASSVPKYEADLTDPKKQRAIVVEDPKLTLTVMMYFDNMDKYDAFMTEKFTSGVTATGAANAVKMGADALGLKDKPSVRPQVEALVAALRNPYTRTISFRWADFSFIGQLTTVQARYTMFSTSGRPVRAQVLLRLQHEMDPAMLHNWYQSFETVFKGEASSWGKASQKIGNLTNINL